MPRTNGVYNLPSPPAPLLPNTLASATDVMTLLSDIGAALTGSVPTDGSAAWVGNQNANNYSLGGISNLGAGAVTANYISATNASIGALAAPLNANNQGISGVSTLSTNDAVVNYNLSVSGGTTLYGPLTADSAANFFGGLSVDAGSFDAFGASYLAGPVVVGGNGLVYNGILSSTHAIGFFWDGNAVSVWVDGNDVGYCQPYGRLEARLAQLEARIAELENELARVAAHA